MSTKGLQRLVRRDVLSRLKADSGVTALAPNIYSQDPGSEPVWPFVKTGSPQTLPRTPRLACADGATINLPLHAFARGVRNGSGQITETAEDHAGRIGAAIEALFNNRRSMLLGGVTVRYSIGDMNLFLDGAEPGAFHYSCTVRARVLAERP